MLLAQGRLDEADIVHLEGLRLKPWSRKRAEAYADFLFDIGREDEAKEWAELAPQLSDRPRRSKK